MLNQSVPYSFLIHNISTNNYYTARVLHIPRYPKRNRSISGYRMPDNMLLKYLNDRSPWYSLIEAAYVLDRQPPHFLCIAFSSRLTAREQAKVRMKYMAVMVIQISKVR